jgi:hypothetical protein
LSTSKIVVPKAETTTDSILVVIQVEDGFSSRLSSSVSFYFSSARETFESSLLWRDMRVIFTESSIDKLTSVTCSAETLLG